MGSDAIITYKRKRTLLKSTDHSHFPSESSVSRNLNTLNKQAELKFATTMEISLKEGHGEETITSVEAVKQDEPGGSSTELSKNRKSSPPLITYSRRSKQISSFAVENIKTLSDTEPAGSCSVDFKNKISNEEKKPLEVIYNASSLSAQAPASAGAMQVDCSLFPITRATDAPSTALASQAARGFDCNLLPEYDSDENLVPGRSDSHCARDSTNKENEQSLALQGIEDVSEVKPVADKGKGLLDSEPVREKGKDLLDSRARTGTSSRNN